MSHTEIQSLLQYSLPPLSQFALPPLPEILDQAIQHQVFTHSSYYAKSRRTAGGMFEERGESLDNEKLEHVGDSALGFAVTGLLHDLYPNLTPGKATAMKGYLVSNATIAQISQHYGLPSRLVADPSALYNLRNGEKTSANLFEAYIAGVFYSYLKHGAHSIPTPPQTPSDSACIPMLEDAVSGSTSMSMSTSTSVRTRGQATDHVESWLRPLFAPLAAWLLDRMKEEQARLYTASTEEDGAADLDEKALGATARLNEWFSHKGEGVPVYSPSPAEGGSWHIKCCAVDKDGKQWFGEATRLSKKAASTVAAYKICQAVGI